MFSFDDHEGPVYNANWSYTCRSSPILLTTTNTYSNPTVAIETLGCKLNQADSSILARQFTEAGFRNVPVSDPSDVYVVNTCTVTHVADRKARQTIRGFRRRNPNSTIVATGCYAQRDPKALDGMEEIDLVIGNSAKDSLVRQVLEWRDRAPVPCAIGDDPETFSPRVSRTRAMVKIQEGCNQVCAYCIVPKVRGRERSMLPDTIVDEINRNVDYGYKEVVLTGTQLGSYGFDLPNMTLTRLLDFILSKTKVTRLRISSLQPQDIIPEMLELWSDTRLCPHFHLPLQSGSNSILNRMRRRYTRNLYIETIQSIREHISNVSITADVITGFPGETERDFEETHDLCRNVRFAAMHVFPYSARPGTSATHFQKQISEQDKSRRTQTLLDLAKSLATEFRRKSLGLVRPVLWEERRQFKTSEMWSGHTDNYIKVTGESTEHLANQVTMARLQSQKDGLVHTQILI